MWGWNRTGLCRGTQSQLLGAPVQLSFKPFSALFLDIVWGRARVASLYKNKAVWLYGYKKQHWEFAGPGLGGNLQKIESISFLDKIKQSIRLMVLLTPTNHPVLGTLIKANDLVVVCSSV